MQSGRISFSFPGSMKVVVFAHTPPPHHGQSYMVELMLRGLADQSHGIECFHVNAHLAKDSDDIGKFRFTKPFLILRYCAQAIWYRFRHRAVTLYYIPAPPVKNPLIRDWVVLLICKQFFHHIVLHWHATGLGEWIVNQPKWMQRLSRLALGHADLSISLGRFNEKDAARFSPQRSVIVPNGIPDPCPNFPEVLAARRTRLARRLTAWNATSASRIETAELVRVRVLYLGLCAEQKGLLDAMRGVCQANALCRANNLPFQFQLTIAGPFLDASHEGLYRKTLAELENPPTIEHVGFANPALKAKLMAETDIFCFPTWYYAENMPLVVAEAMAFGIPILATKWRSVPDLFPANYPGLVDIKSPDQIASTLVLLAARDDAEGFRQRFLENFTLDKFLRNLSAAFHEANNP